ncbi:aspartate racemase [Geopyxis carbonaria]|nr:aspartate racemase [Geopyxis carbonaria]
MSTAAPASAPSLRTVKTLGLLGGMSWESSSLYYTLINRHVHSTLGGVHSAPTIMHSFDFAAIEALQAAGDWDAAGKVLADAAATLERSGAAAIVLCTNTMHKLAPAIEAAVSIPLLHIADFTGAAIVAAGVKRVGLLGTRFTMVEDFYKQRLVEKFGLEVIIPDPAGIDVVHGVIYEELVKGTVSEESRAAYLKVIEDLVRRGAGGVILGCTEIGMLVKDEHVTDVPLFDTTELHARGAAEWAMEL